MTLSELFAHVHTLPPLPTVVQALLTQSSRSTHVDTLVDLIEQDAVICAKLLKVANSAHFKRTRDIGTTAQAVQVLGLNNVRTLVISLGLMAAFSGVHATQTRPLWRHNLCTAALARHWAAHVGVDPDVAYTLGLVRHLGQMVMRIAMPEPMRQLDDQQPPTAPERLALERQTLGYATTDVSAELARCWHWPTTFEVVLVASAQPTLSAEPASPANASQAVADPQHSSLAALVHLAAWQVWAQEQTALTPEAVWASWPSALAQSLALPARAQDVVLPTLCELCPSLDELLA